MRQTKARRLFAAILCVVAVAALAPPAGWSNCTNGVKIPAFLASGIDPNLLLIIDNSASMNDLAYIGAQGTCYDDSYSSAETYAGYFKNSTWYSYSLNNKQFEASPTDPCGSYSYKADGQVCISVNTGAKEVTQFAAKGNFLNWAAASKLDIQKKILTGGKYDSSSKSMTMESRGCLDRRYVKKIAVKNSANSTFYITLGVRPPEANEKDTSTDSTSHIEVYEVTSTGFNNGPCQSLITLLQQDPSNGGIKQLTDECMTYNSKDKATANAMNAFNHSLQDCWFASKHGWPDNNNGSITSIKNDCDAIYKYFPPENIEPEHRAYVCTSKYVSEDYPAGYVGRCWNPVTKTWLPDECVNEALKDYCRSLKVPLVIDPSDQSGITEEFWNIPAVLIDSGVTAQLSQPWLVMKGRIALSAGETPSGIIQEMQDDLRIGAMVFNADGSKSECSRPDPYILYKCSDPANRDGGKIVFDIGQGTTHTQGLIAAINEIKATSWTPLAEALYNAVGYYTQNSALQLDGQDFRIGSDCDPVNAWCQSNNILLITDGGSTADLNSSVFSFASPKNPDTDPVDGCGQLFGSTLLNDLTYYAKSGTGIYPNEPWREIVDGQATKTKQNITTHIVVGGELRTIGTGDCSPDALLTSAAVNGGTTLYSATNPAELEAKIRQAFAAIRSGAASGSAASVISSSRGGEGALYQATFWPSLDGLNGTKISWTGEVHALFVNDQSEMLEDTNQNGVMDSSDTHVLIYYDKSVRDSKACYGTLNTDGSCSGTSKKIQDVKYLWSASGWLNSISDTDILSNRSAYISNEKKRYIFTWNDINNDGVADQGTEIKPFVDTNSWESMVTTYTTRGPVPLDFGVRTDAEVNQIVRWIRGQDQTGLRSRQVAVDSDNNGVYDSAKTWRLGDVIHSTPIPVSRPSEAYHTVYRDSSYAYFVNQYKNRRHVIYFGGNDGMVHAVNGGFYDGANKRFCRSANCASESTAPELGAELWAYVPYNLTPHLKCLTATDYSHKYYVDLQPRIFDVQIFGHDSVHPGGWGTIMVVGMGFGGAKVLPGDLDLNQDGTKDYATDDRIFTSAYMIFDITNPESPPVLLGEFTRKKTGSHVDLGFTTSVPALVPMKSGSNTDWYLILGSGPDLIEGESTLTAKIGVLPLKHLTAATKGAFQIPGTAPSSTSERGSYELTDKSFVGDIVSVDFALDREYKSDAVYFGTVQGSFSPTPSWSGKLYRLVTRKMGTDADGHPVRVAAAPDEWPYPSVLIDAQQPVTAAPAIGWDGKNYWVYFGTGRFLDEREKSDSSQQSFYGIKEPLDCDRNFTWTTVEKTGTHNGVPGDQGLLRVDQIQVHQDYTDVSATLSCKDGSSCLPTDPATGLPVSSLKGLLNYIVGHGCATADPTGTDGWYMQFEQPRERNLGQGTLLGGLLTFTTYQPYNDVCLSEGLSNLYGVYYQTGTGWYKPVFGTNGVTTDGNTVSMLPLGHGLSKQPNLHVGKKDGSTVFLQSSTGAILEIQQPNLPLKNTKTGKVSWNQNLK